MKNLILFLLFLLSLNSKAQSSQVQKTIEKFFEGFNIKDSIQIKSVCADKIIWQSIQENLNGGKLSHESASEFYKSIISIPANFKFQEKIISYSIQVDGSMAHAWTPYEFYVNDKLSHKGVNAFTLLKENNQWKIIYCIDTRKK